MNSQQTKRTAGFSLEVALKLARIHRRRDSTGNSQFRTLVYIKVESWEGEKTKICRSVNSLFSTGDSFLYSPPIALPERSREG